MASTSTYIRNYRTEIPGAMIVDHYDTWQFPIIESINSHGKKIFWKIYIRLFEMRNDIILPDVPEDAFIQISDALFDSKPLPENIHAWINIDSGVENGKIKKSTPT